MKSNPPQKKQTEKLIKSSNLFPVVGIGASAGGLDAFKKLLKAIPENSGMAFVLVQHLDPNHDSMLPELLQKVTSIPVLEIADDIKVEPNHIYVIPSNKMMVATDGVLLLAPRPAKSKTERNMPIDLFFASLAEVHQSHAIGVVLSGTGTDGTLGLKNIKDHGGITFAQDESSASYEGMPHSAVQANVVDFILSPEKIPNKLLELTPNIGKSDEELQNLPQQEEEVFKQILSLLRVRKGTDFTYYKQTTIRRRILRRMALNKNEEPAVYLKFLRENKSEQDVLFQDLLIPVTSFFRDTKSFDHLSETVFPGIIKNKTPGELIRVLVAGCSTGEETYSIAICFKELLDDNRRMQIFATDLSEPAITKARTGIYTKREVENVSPKRLLEFFKKTNGSYQLNKNIRDMCVFATHNFLKDPPFGKMDFISCRNVLIYMEPYLQKKALTTFHYALNPKGLLLLGKTETISGVPDLFASVAIQDKLFIRKDVPGKFMQVTSQRSEQTLSPVETSTVSEPIRTDFQKTADDIILRKYTPSGVVVNESMDIVYFRGKTGNYLEQSPGKPSHNLLQMAKNGLAFELRNILHKTKKSKVAEIKGNIPLQIDGRLHHISIEALPLPNTIEPHYLILFHDQNTSIHSPGSGNENKKTSTTKNEATDLRIQQLEQELQQTREDMRSITEDQEAANEELQSANEELLSSSEELQSLNEELETGKEELQSTNEELTVVNHEIISLNEQVTEARDYSEAIVSNIREPLLVLDKNLRIKSANNAFYKTFRINEQDTEGVLIYDLGDNHWDIPTFKTLLEKILPEKSKITDFEITYTFSETDKRILLLNAREVINKNSAEKLILLSIEDITERKKAQEVIRKTSEYFRGLVKGLPAGVYSCDAEGRINFYNDAAVKIWGRAPVLGKESWCGSYKLFNPDGSLLPPDKCPMAIALKEGRAILGQEIIIERKDGTRSNVLVHPHPEFGLNGEITGAINMVIDISEQVASRKKIEESEKRYTMMFMQSPFGFAVLKTKDMVIAIANDSVKKVWGKGNNVEGKRLLTVLPEIKNSPAPALLDKVYKTGVPYYGYEMLIPLKRKGKLEDVYFNFVYQPYLEADESISGVAIIAYEVTSEVTIQKSIEQSEKEFRQMAELMPQKIWTSDTKGKKTYFNKTLLDFIGHTSQELKEIPWRKFIHPEDWKKYKKNWQQSIETGKRYEAENRLLRKDGKYIWHLTLAVPIKDELGKIKLWVGTKTEIQEQREQKEQLEKAVLKRTLELRKANKALVFESLEREKRAAELIIANKKLVVESEEKEKRAAELISVNKELEAFAYVSSHDMQEPLRKIQTFAGRILEKENPNLSENGKNYFRLMKDAANRMQTLIEDIFTFSRLTSAERKFVTTDLNKIIANVIIELKENIDEKHAVIVATDLCPANIIPYQFQQLMQNLISNAIKFSKPKVPPHIIISSRIITGIKIKNQNFSPKKRYCHISVTDNGIGFEKQFREKVFEVFQRLHGKEEYAGTGIGLAIVKKIVDNHNGTITANSRLNKGTTFDIYIPVDSTAVLLL